jgi:hypothetical protein
MKKKRASRCLWSPVAVLSLGVVGCRSAEGQPTPVASSGRGAGTPGAVTVDGPIAERRSPPLVAVSASGQPAVPAVADGPSGALDSKAYPWLQDPSCKGPAAVSTLQARFPAPKGFARVPLAPHGFGAFLRTLPLASPETPVLTYAGKVLHPADHPNVAAVAAIDPGTADLQQCADSVIRLHAEWRWAEGKRDQSYRAAAGMEIPYSRWKRGERPVAKGASLDWQRSGAPVADGAEEHSDFRKFLSSVFMFANTGSLSVQAKPVSVKDLAPGDFVVVAGSPGHAVLVLDLVRSPSGERRVLLGQGFMPAQSFHVLRASANASPFYVIDENAPLDTPFWDPFPWSALRRFP